MIQRSLMRSYPIVIVTLVFFCASSHLFAQDFKKQFQTGKDQFAAENYSSAMVSFKPLMVYDKNNPYSEYASFYYALSAYRLGYLSVAKEQFLQLKKTYPDWNQLEEVNYILSKIYFEQGEFFQALHLADQVQSLSFKNDLQNLKRQYLSRVEDPETLRMMWEDHPSDEEVGRALVKQMSKAPGNPQDTVLINSIIRLFHFSREEVAPDVSIKPIHKEEYRIGLIMPFLAESLEPSPVKKRNQFILELYQGMNFATDTLKSMGINLQLLAYDNERNKDATIKLLKEPELKSLDIIVGPLFQEESKPVQDFSIANQISVVISPLSNSTDCLEKNPNCFLFQPSHERIGQQAAEFAAKYSTKKSCMIYFGESAKDSAMAANFISRAKELNLKILHMEQVGNESGKSILSKLSTATEFDEWKNPLQFSLKKDSIGCIFVASSNELIYSKVINSIETRKDSTLVIGQESWLTESSVDYSKYERVRIALTSPNFIDLESVTVKDFRKKYITRYGVLPTEYSFAGFEFIMTMGKILKQYGTNFLQTMTPGVLIDGTLMQGYQFSTMRDNEKVPFVMVKKGKLKKIE